MGFKMKVMNNGEARAVAVECWGLGSGVSERLKSPQPSIRSETVPSPMCHPCTTFQHPFMRISSLSPPPPLLQVRHGWGDPNTAGFGFGLA